MYSGWTVMVILSSAAQPLLTEELFLYIMLVFSLPKTVAAYTA